MTTENMTVEYLLWFCISLLDLSVFWHYMLAFRKMKYVSEPAGFCALILLAFVWAGAGIQQKPYLNLAVLVLILMLVTLLFEGTMKTKAASVIIFIGVGIVVEPIGMILLQAVHYVPGASSIYLYYFVTAVCALIRGDVIYLLCWLMFRKELNLLKLPREITVVLVVVFVFSVVNCCLVTILSMEMDSIRSRIMCISVISTIVLTYCFMFHMIERLNYLVKKQHEDELYIEEMYHKEIYYAEVERRDEYVQKLRHDLKNRIFGFHYLIKEGNTEALLEKIGALCSELEQIDGDSYSENPSVDTVLRIKLGVAKSEGIRVETLIRIPKRMGMEQGDTGVLYGNLLDNAIEACRKVPEKERFIRVENKYSSGKLLLVVTNSKENWKNERLNTTKKDTYSHGRGISSVRRVVENYNGVVQFTDQGTVFEASVMLYGIGMEEKDKK